MAQINPQESLDSVSAVLGRIVTDIQQLLRQEFALARVETRREILQAKTASLMLGVAMGLLGAGALLALLMLVRLIELAGVPLWASYGLVALFLLVGGAIALEQGRKKLREVDPIPRETVRTMQENIQWLKKQT